LINVETEELKQWNLSTNTGKSHIIKYTNSKAKYKENFVEEDNICMNDEEIEWNQESNLVKFLGFDLDFNNKYFLKHHFEQKLERFEKLRKRLYVTGKLGNEVPINVQCKLYLSKIRMAFIYGLNVVNLTKTDYGKIVI
jgi:hypothetical protein